MKTKIKILLLAISAIALSHAAMAQTWSGSGSATGDAYRTGNVGIGTNTPAEKLDVSGNITVPFGNFFGTSGTTYKKLIQTGWDATNFDYLSFYTAGANAADQNEKMRITMNGNVGIGTDIPKARLHIYESTPLNTGSWQFMPLTTVSGKTGLNAFHHSTWLQRNNTAYGNWLDVDLVDGISIDVSFSDLNPANNNAPKTWWRRNPYEDRQNWGDGNNTYMELNKGRLGINRTSPSARLDVEENDNNYISLLARSTHSSDGKYCIMASVTRDLTKAFTVGNNVGAYKEPFVVYGNGQTRIGIKSSTAHTNAMLTVDGKIVCKDLYVTASSDWPDFVFDANYKLANLNDVRDYLMANKHLPNVPTACEIEEKGINMSEMSAIQMQKIEELTLYIIQLKTELDELKKQLPVKTNTNHD